MSVKSYILATPKSWHDTLFENLKTSIEGNWYRVKTTSELESNLRQIKAAYIFLPHWSDIISEDIIGNHECVIFHMTDLPYGRGGSPLQNLIVRGHKDTKISAIRASKGIDTGDIYLKKDLSLEGSATDIFARSSKIIEEMILEIVQKNPVPEPQTGTPVIFKRRTPDMSSMDQLTELNEVYDHIRMLDAEGYPHAFLESNDLKIEFKGATFDGNEVRANVRITKK